MISYEKRMNAFILLGKFLAEEVKQDKPTENGSKLSQIISKSSAHNPWFTENNIMHALSGIGESLKEDKMKTWLGPYAKDLKSPKQEKTIGVVMAGNIPLVGFHDFLCVLMSGNRFLGKLSSDDTILLPALANKLIEIEPEFNHYIEFENHLLHGFDAIIATGSNNTSRYFDYYFGKYPGIIRKNRNGAAVLTGKESTKDLEKLGEDVFLYFGMGCRNVSKLFVPKGYTFDRMFEAFEKYKYVGDNYKYNNNYEYYKSIYLINTEQHFDNGFLLLKEESRYASPPAVLYFEYYKDINDLIQRIKDDENLIQCVLSQAESFPEAVPFGKAQKPELWDYSDGVDTMKFLVEL